MNIGLDNIQSGQGLLGNITGILCHDIMGNAQCKYPVLRAMAAVKSHDATQVSTARDTLALLHLLFEINSWMLDF